MIIDLNTKETFQLGIGEKLDLLLTVWSPVGNAIAFVFENNIYYRSSVKAESTIQITRDTGFINNGIPDWVYEEEVFSSNTALWFSPNGQRLAYGRFDDTNTPNMFLPIYGEPGNLAFQYPRAQLIKYPKAGTQNPTVTLHWVDLSNSTEVQRLEPPAHLVHE